MRTLELKNRTPIIGAKTFLGAVNRNKKSSQRIAADMASRQLFNRKLDLLRWEDDRLAMFLEGDIILEFCAIEQEIIWRLAVPDNSGTAPFSYNSPSDTLMLSRKCRNGKVLVSSMDRSAIMHQIIGRKIRAIGVNEFGPLIVFDGDSNHLALHAQQICGSGDNLLEWYYGN
jgi:hypothetical protein